MTDRQSFDEFQQQPIPVRCRIVDRAVVLGRIEAAIRQDVAVNSDLALAPLLHRVLDVMKRSEILQENLKLISRCEAHGDDVRGVEAGELGTLSLDGLDR